MKKHKGLLICAGIIVLFVVGAIARVMGLPLVGPTGTQPVTVRFNEDHGYDETADNVAARCVW